MSTLATHSNTLTAPTRPGSFPFGNLHEFRRDGINIFINAAREQGDVARIRFGPNVLYQVNHPDGVRHVLQSNNRNYSRDSYANNLIKSVTGLNLFTSDGDYWLRQRRLMQPAFHRRRLENLGEIMTGATHRLLERWAPAIAHGETLDMHAEMMRITMDVVGQALFSVDLTAETSTLGKAFLTSTDYVNYRFSTPFDLPLWVPTRRNRNVNQAVVDVRRIIQEMIDERRRTGEQKDDLLAMLMEARDEETGETMDDEQVRVEAGIVIGAGQETTSNLLTWTFHVLSEHPEIEARLLAELDAALAGRTPAMDDLPNLPYLRMLVDEVLRMYPPAWAISSRNAYEDDTILGYGIPKKSLVFILPYIIHRDPRFWDRPEQIIPERFTEENAADRHKYAYLPFGAGPRKCIGNTFALVEAQLILATMLQKVRLVKTPGYAVEPDLVFTLRVKGGLPMKILAR
jgi:cytochrome P450